MKTHPISMTAPPAPATKGPNPGETWLVRFSGEPYSTPLHVMEVVRHSTQGRAVLMKPAGMEGFVVHPRWFSSEETDFLEQLPANAPN